MHTTVLPPLGPIDEQGRLLHDGDLCAQLVYAVTRLEAVLAAGGQTLADLRELRVHTTDPGGLDDVYDVLTERLAATRADPAVVVRATTALPVPGMLVALDGFAVSTIRTIPVERDSPMSDTVDTPAATPPGPAASAASAVSAERLRGLCGGRVHLPGDPGYDVARTPWNLAVDQRPAAVALPHTVEEVREIVRAATQAGLRIAPQSTGHGAGPLGERILDRTVIVRLSELTGVEIDPIARIARVAGGTLWRDVVAAAAPHGLTALHGSAGDVAVAGYALAGGASFYGRRHGLAVNAVRAVELVDARGELLRASADENAELFWAVRGGGGSFGVVVAIELELLPYADVYAGMLLWDRERAPEVLRAWASWTAVAPEEATTSLRVMSFPPLPELPPFLRGRDVVVVDGAILLPDADADALLAPLRALAPELDTFGRIPSAALLQVHMDPPMPTPTVSEHRVLASLPEEAVAAFLAEIGPGTRSGLTFGELRHLGAAFSRRPEHGGAIAHVEGAFGLFAIAIAPTPEAAAGGRAAATRLAQALEPWTAPGRLLTFSENGLPHGVGFGAAHERVAAAALQADPERVLVANHPVR